VLGGLCLVNLSDKFSGIDESVRTKFVAPVTRRRRSQGLSNVFRLLKLFRAVMSTPGV